MNHAHTHEQSYFLGEDVHTYFAYKLMLYVHVGSLDIGRFLACMHNIMIRPIKWCGLTTLP